MPNWIGFGFDPTCHSLSPQPSEFLIYESSECLISPTDLQALEQPLCKQLEHQFNELTDAVSRTFTEDQGLIWQNPLRGIQEISQTLHGKHVSVLLFLP